MIFRVFIFKEWFGGDETMSKYYNNNKAIVKLHIQYYWVSWKERNELMNKDDVKIKYILEQFDNENRKERFQNL